MTNIKYKIITQSFNYGGNLFKTGDTLELPSEIGDRLMQKHPGKIGRPKTPKVNLTIELPKKKPKVRAAIIRKPKRAKKAKK